MLCPCCNSCDCENYAEIPLSVSGAGGIVRRSSTTLLCPACLNAYKARCNGDACAVEEVCNSYCLHDVDDHVEQRVAYDRYSGGIRRSRYSLEFLLRQLSLGQHGRYLDVGCHFGSMIREFDEMFPRWEKVGFDISERFHNSVSGIGKNTSFVSGDISSLKGSFDLISIVNALEQVDDPLKTLLDIKKRLKPGGYLFLQCCDLAENPYLPLIYEQNFNYSHFGLFSLLGCAGFDILTADKEWSPKDLHIIATPGRGKAKTPEKKTAHSRLREGADLLRGLLDSREVIAELGPQVGIFGTAYPSLWFANLVGNYASFFVD